LAKLLKNKDINTNDYQNVNKIRIKLANRGFNYDIINMVLKEVHNDETY
jgi:SOS response regulatory protein OraA/RecX